MPPCFILSYLPFPNHRLQSPFPLHYFSKFLRHHLGTWEAASASQDPFSSQSLALIDLHQCTQILQNVQVLRNLIYISLVPLILWIGLYIPCLRWSFSICVHFEFLWLLWVLHCREELLHWARSKTCNLLRTRTWTGSHHIRSYQNHAT